MTTATHTVSLRLLPIAFASLVLLAAPGCGDEEAAAKPAPQAAGHAAASPSTKMLDPDATTEAAATALLTAFLQPNADMKALSQRLRPTKEDYATVFHEEFATKLRSLYDPGWESGALVLKANDGQTALLLHGVATEQIHAWSAAASENLPGGYEKIKGEFKPGFTVYAFKFVKPGESLGMAYDGLVHVNGHWRLFPKPFRAAR